MPTTTSPTMTERQFQQLAKIIYDRSGISFKLPKKYVLESRLAHRLIELEIETFDDYISLLSMGPFQQDEFQEMFNRITINETSFFRNEPQLAVFEREALPLLLDARKATKRLRIWSAACSTGEEPYTLAMLLDRTLGVRLPDWRVEILGTDISERALDIASEGKYTDYALRSTNAAHKARYFTQSGSMWQLSPSIKQMVNFELHNLRDRASARRHGLWDVIFCRNVMIYFDDAMVSQVLHMFADQLADDGFLFIGHSETIRPGEAPFTPTPQPQGFCYRKIAKGLGSSN
ncbi:MAG: protein-glutamate O-methyltransferase CheR [Planctomycetota bacterium]|nr:protein-glutamate O-methyltransferase CheR [Planctomycetota bacterium]